MDFDEFVGAHLAALGRYAGVLTGDRHLAEDVLSDALITASVRWDLIGQMEYPLAYVRRIVASAFVADRRLYHRRRTTAQADPAGSLVSPEEDAQGRLEDRDQLDRLLRGLTPTQRAAVVMRFYLDLPDADIAQALGCSLGNVRSTISRALGALRLTQPAERG
ncbi:MAG: SigE family RNA polymerase sigma factor [Nakamurella sp.]